MRQIAVGRRLIESVKRSLEVTHQRRGENVRDVLRGHPVFAQMVDVAIRSDAGEAVLAAIFGSLPPEKVAIHLGLLAEVIVDANLGLVIAIQVWCVSDVVVATRKILCARNIGQRNVLEHSGSGGIDIARRQ